MRRQARVKRGAAILSLAIGAALVLPVAASAARGDLDPSFAGDGVAVTAFPSYLGGRSYANAEAVTRQRHGRVVVAGSAVPYDGSGPDNQSDFAFARYQRNGELDPSFGDHGRLLIDIGSADEATDLARFPRGRIIAVGRSDARARRLARRVTVVVLKPDGEPDPTFGDGGSTLVKLPRFGRPAAVAVQPDGRVVIGGWMDEDFFVIRLRANGDLDRSFAGNGFRRLDFDRPGVTSSDDDLTDLAIDRRGRIAASGTTYQRSTKGPRIDFDFAIARLKPSGRLDRSFSGDGRRTLNVRRDQPAETESDHDGAAALVAHPSGSLTLTGEVLPKSHRPRRYSYPRVAVVQVDRRGRLDQQFAGDGTRITPVKRDGRGTDIALRSDGRIVVSAEGYSTRRVAILRYSRSGRLDRSFSRDGLAAFKVDHFLSTSIALGPNQKAVVAGTTSLVNRFGFYVARFSRHGAR